MDNSKNLELEILVNVRQNKKVPVSEFCRLFEHRWLLYDDIFNQLKMEGFFAPVQVQNLYVYQLTPIGKARIAQLIQQREQEITLRLLHLKQLNQLRYNGWKSVMSLLNTIVHFRTPLQKSKESETAIANKA
jgi:hypothetical protein